MAGRIFTTSMSTVIIGVISVEFTSSNIDAAACRWFQVQQLQPMIQRSAADAAASLG